MFGEVVVVAAITGACAVVGSWLASRSKLRRIEAQVTNDHDSNLRDDITDITDKVILLTEQVVGVRGDVLDMKDDVVRARTDVRAVDERLTATKRDADVHHSQLWLRLGQIAGRVDSTHEAVTGELPVIKLDQEDKLT